MNVAETRALITYPVFRPVPLKAETNRFTLDYYRPRPGECVRVVTVGDEVRGVYGSHGREVISPNSASNIDIYV